MSTKIRGALALGPLVALLASIAGCGRGDEGGASLPPGGATSELVEVLCEKLVECPSPFFDDVIDSMATCRLVFATPDGIDLDELLDETIDETRTRHDPIAEARCLEEMRHLSCERFYDGPEPAVCREVYVGLGAEGAPCRHDLECAGGFCDVPEDACEGTCARALGEGEPCEGEVPCGAGLDCADGLCAPEEHESSREGEGCIAWLPDLTCGYGLYCAEESWTCQRKREHGASCDVDAACRAPGACVDGRCVRIEIVHSAGSPCDPEAARPCSAAEGLVCALNEEGEGTTCRRGGREGETCVDREAGLFFDCDPRERAYCDLESGRCVPPKEAGAACESGDECESDVCEDGVCAPEDEDPCL